MNYQQGLSKQNFICNIIPPFILESIVKNGNQAQRALAQKALIIDQQIRLQRTARLQEKLKLGKVQGTGAPRKNRLIYTSATSTNLPGRLVRSEGQPATNDVAVNETYNGLGATFDLYFDIYGRNSINDNGMDMIGTVHFGNQYANAFWDGNQMVFGDGDEFFFERFTIAIDIMGHELTHGVIEWTARLEYHDQSGALNESISDVFGSLVKQRSLGQTAAQADWLIGAGIFTNQVNGVALRSMKAPGTAYNDPLLGRDPQPDHMSRYVNTTDDFGGVHFNSGIPNKAFYLAAIAIGGNAWDIAGKIWYRTLLDPRLSPTAQFKDFALLTVQNANVLFGPSVKASIIQAWHDVGIDVADQQGWSGWKSLGGGFIGNPTVVSWAPNRLDVFVRGTDNALWHQWGNGSNWADWESLGGVLTSDPVAVSWGPNRLDVFVRGGDEGLYHHSWDGSAWSGWRSLGGGFIGNPTVVSWAPNRLDVFVRGTDNALWHQWGNGSNWADWESLGGVLTSDPVAVSWGPNRLDVFVRGSDNGLHYHLWDGSAWSGWRSLGGGLIGNPAVVSWTPNRLDVFVRGTDNALYIQSWNGSAWSGWRPLGGGLVGNPAVASWGPNRLDVFVRGTDNALHYLSSNGWESLGGILTSDPVAVSWGPNRLDVFVRGGDNGLYCQSLG